MYEYRKLTPEQRAALVRERVARGFPPHAPPHPNQGDQTYLLTAACYEHTHLMQAATRRREVLDALFEQLVEQGAELRAWVLLPNHYHLLVRLDDLRVVGEILRRIHGATSRRWNLEDDRQGRKVWYRFTDRAIRSERHYFATLNYIHYNPVKHGWVSSPYDWAESSVHWYVEHQGREWLRDVWARYPVRGLGIGWDDMEEPGGLPRC